ncbi:MAG: hypothetical protein SGI89_04360 [bacterium]|nr:hypothetical protein [bacterium]
MIHSILSLNTFWLFVIVLVLSAGLSLLALTIIRKKIGWEIFRENHEVGGFLFNALGLIYAVLIAFVVFATWDEYDSALEYCDKEAIMLQDIFLNSEGLPEESEKQIKQKVLEYLEGVINEDWPLLAVDQSNPKTKEKLIEIWQLYMSIDTLRSEKEKIYFQESISKLNDVTDYRRMRILSSQSHIPVIIWTVIIFGALTSVGFSLFFGTKSLKIQSIMTALFVMTNAIVLLLILDLDHPFAGDTRIMPEPFEYVLEFLKNYSRNHP